MKSFSRSIAISALIGLAVALIAAVAAETTAPSLAPVAKLVPKMRKNDLSPLAATEKAIATHAPFETGECSLCHQRNDPKSPGHITTPVNEQCLGCHDDYQKLLSGKSGRRQIGRSAQLRDTLCPCNARRHDTGENRRIQNF